jgi:hypothetical protein
LKTVFGFYGGSVSEEYNGKVTHVVLDATDEAATGHFQELNASGKKKFHVVPPDWVEESFDSGRILEERAFSTPTVDTPRA